MIPNKNYAQLKDSYLFFRIKQKVQKYSEEHPGARLYRLGVGDVTLPLCSAVIDALHEAVDDQASAGTFHGYMPENGAPFLRSAIAGYYRNFGVTLKDDEVFVSSGASDELGDILDLFDRSLPAMITDPVYPAYIDANIMAGRQVIHVPCYAENGFIPAVPEGDTTALIYICSPNNPTGAVLTRTQLAEWVGYALRTGSVILFDAAYEAFIQDADYPHSIFEIEGSENCAIEICSFSKTAGFTGTRLGYTVIRETLEREGMYFHDMWLRNRTAKTNGVSYIIQKGGAAVFSEAGQRETRENIAFYKENAGIIRSALQDADIYCTGGSNSPYIWMKCPDGMGSWEFFDLLLNEAQVIGTPGVGFGDCGKGYFRFSAFGSREDTIEAAERIKRLLQSFIIM